MKVDLLEQVLEWIQGKHFGKYRGVVVDNEDETARGRLKVRAPAVLGDLEVWAMPCVPYAGPGVGFYAMPPAGAGVWVEFEGGDSSFPIWSGCFWADRELPAKVEPKIKIWKSDKLTVRLDDGKDEALIESSGKAQVKVNASVLSKGGKSTVQVAGSGVTTKTGKTVEIEAASFKVNNGSLEVSS